MRRRNNEAWRAVLVGLLVVFALAAGADAFDRKQRKPQIRVVGHGEVSAAPDRVSLDVAVVTRASTAELAAADNAATTSAVLASLKATFPEAAEISTRGYALNAEYDYDKREGKRTPAGFSARNTIHVALADVGGAGRLIDAAVAAGANDVQAVRFSVAETSPLVTRALAAAAVDARAKAAALAEGMGMKLGRVIRVEETGVPSPQPRMMAYAEAARASTPIEPGDVFVAATVSLWVELVEQ